ncbi:hypothetical protein JCM6882_005691 [Rhodosporidiobolus microsporus]
MLATKRKASLVTSKGKGKARAPAQPLQKRAKVDAQPKRSNRPVYGAPSESGSSSGGEDSEEDSEDDEDSRRAAMLAALEAHQAALLGDSAPFASTSRASAVKEAKKETKSVWDLGMDDLEDEEESDEEEEDEDVEEEEEMVVKPGRAAAVQVVAFSEPGRGDGPSIGASPAPMNKKEMRDFKAGKIKNMHAKASIADAANVMYVGGKAKAKAKAAAQGKAVAQNPEQAKADAAEESHLDKLDSHLSALIKPLTAPGSSASLPDLLRDLPIAPTKALKGHTPLPKNAPRLLRRGQNAANLKRAQSRDDAAGNAVGSKKGLQGMGREALSLKEKRKLDGTDKRQRGIGGAVGKMGRGQLSLSKKEISKISGSGGGR